jgi:hypothetical protein
MRLVPIIAVFSSRCVAVTAALGLLTIALFTWPESVASPDGPLGALDRRAIPAGLRPPDPPGELVAVLGQVGGLVTEELYSVAVSSDGRWIVTGTRGGAIRLHDVPTLSLQWQRHGHTRPVRGLDFAPDGQSLVSVATDGTMRRWAIDGHPLPGDPDVGDSGPVGCVVHSPDGRTVATGSLGRVRLWNVTEVGFTLVDEALIPGCPVQALAFSPDGRTLACGGGGDNGLRLLSVGVGPATVRAVLPRPREDQVRGLAFGPGDSHLACMDTDGNGTVRQASSMLSVWRVPCPPIHRAVFARDGRHLLTLHGTGRVYVWRLRQAWPDV